MLRVFALLTCVVLSLGMLQGCGSATGADKTSAPAPTAPSDPDWKSKIIPTVASVSMTSTEKVEKVEFPWGRITWLMSGDIDPKATMTYGLVTIDAGKGNPLHIHPNCEEYLHVTSGSCEHVVGDKVVTLKAGDVIRIPQNVPHKAKALGDVPCDAVIAFNTPHRQIIALEEGQE